MRVADIDSDGRPDLIVAHAGWSVVGVYLQQASGGLAPEQRFQAPYRGGLNPQVMAVGDISGDGRTDIVIAGSLLLQRPAAVLAAR